MPFLRRRIEYFLLFFLTPTVLFDSRRDFGSEPTSQSPNHLCSSLLWYKGFQIGMRNTSEFYEGYTTSALGDQGLSTFEDAFRSFLDQSPLS